MTAPKGVGAIVIAAGPKALPYALADYESRDGEAGAIRPCYRSE
jgi:hypothetical protein